jgi:ABC-type amino acid transport system permease subunit
MPVLHHFLMTAAAPLWQGSQMTLILTILAMVAGGCAGIWIYLQQHSACPECQARQPRYASTCCVCGKQLPHHWIFSRPTKKATQRSAG